MNPLISSTNAIRAREGERGGGGRKRREFSSLYSHRKSYTLNEWPAILAPVDLRTIRRDGKENCVCSKIVQEIIGKSSIQCGRLGGESSCR